MRTRYARGLGLTCANPTRWGTVKAFPPVPQQRKVPMDRGTSLPHNSRLPLYPLRLLRLQPGEECTVWITHHVEGGMVKGLFTRHNGERSEIISRSEALEKVKGRPGVWKGYLSALEWRAPEKKWLPVVLEITERSEQDFRGKIARGQVWRVWKGPKDRKKKIALRAAFLESRPEETTPPALDVLPKLRNDIFRQDQISLESDNPLPDLVVVIAVDAPAPGEKAGAASTPPQSRPIKFSDRFGGGPRPLSDALDEMNREANAKAGAK